MAANSIRDQNEAVNGYDIDLASGEQVDTKYICPICLSVLRDAMQTACGHRFCKACISRVTCNRPWAKCPVDKTVLRKPEQLFNDIAIRREILSLKVKCKNSDGGCSWQGELRDEEKHIQECLMAVVTCPVGCEKLLKRGHINQHKDQCPQRSVICIHCSAQIAFQKIHKHEVVDCPKYPVSCTLCGQGGIPRGEIARHMDSTSGNCPQANISCKFRPVGCPFQDKRKDMQIHYDHNIESHLSLLTGKVVELKLTNDQLQDELNLAKGKLSEMFEQLCVNTQTLKQVKERTVHGRLTWKLDLSSMQPLPAMVFSPAFYSACPGYQIRLRLDFRGVVEGDDVYSSVFVVLQKGEFDRHLMFPFNGQIRLTLVPQHSTRSILDSSVQPISSVITCKDVPRNTTGNINSRVNSRGRVRFAKQKDILSTSYLKNNALFFDITVVNPSETCTSANAASNCNSGVLPRSPQ